MKSFISSQVSFMLSDFSPPLPADQIHFLLFSSKNVPPVDQIFPLASFAIRTLIPASFITKTFIAAARIIPGPPTNLGNVLVCGGSRPGFDRRPLCPAELPLRCISLMLVVLTLSPRHRGLRPSR
jgi:hypothetical protein